MLEDTVYVYILIPQHFCYIHNTYIIMYQAIIMSNEPVSIYYKLYIIVYLLSTDYGHLLLCMTLVR